MDDKKGNEIEKTANQMRKAGAIPAELHQKVICQILLRRALSANSVELLTAVVARASEYRRFQWLTDAQFEKIEAEVSMMTVKLASDGSLAQS